MFGDDLDASKEVQGRADLLGLWFFDTAMSSMTLKWSGYLSAVSSWSKSNLK